MDENERVRVYPPSCSTNVVNTYMFVADSQTAIVQGYVLQYDGKVCDIDSIHQRCEMWFNYTVFYSKLSQKKLG